MECPTCSNGASKVLDSRKVEKRVYRRRECKACGFLFTTYETYDESASRPALPKRVKKKMNLDQQARQVVSRIKLPAPPGMPMPVTRTPTPQVSLTVPGSTATKMSDQQLERARQLRDFLNSRGEEDDE